MGVTSRNVRPTKGSCLLSASRAGSETRDSWTSRASFLVVDYMPRCGQGHRPDNGNQRRRGRVPAQPPMPAAGRPLVGSIAATRPECDAGVPGSE
jgi:hypothetical protein